VTLRLRLTLLFVALMACVGMVRLALVIGGFSHTLWSATVTDVRHRADEVNDYLREVGAVAQDAGARLPRTFSDHGMYIQLTGLDGRLLTKSGNLGDGRLPPAERPGVEKVVLPVTGLGHASDAVLVTRPLVLSDGRPAGWVQVAYPLARNQRTLNQFIFVEVAGWLTSLLIALVVGLFVAGRALRPVATMTREVREMHSTDLHRRLPVSPHPRDEIGQLASTFNALFDRLETAFEAQRRFVADASHELKSPLTTVRGNLQLLQRHGAENPTEARAWAEAALKEVDRLTRLVNELLALARLGEDSTLETQPVDLSAIAAEVTTQFTVIAPRVAVATDGPAVVLGHADRLRQVLINLVDNAVRATREGGTVKVRVWRADREVRLTVADTGVGIPVADLPRLFDRFYRVDHARGRAQGGTGLGLAITASIVKAHGGTIVVESAPGQGATFTVRLPVYSEQG
jgi:heavy metal sensor kinase